MPNITLPDHISTDMFQVLNSIVRAIEELETPTISKRRTLLELAEGQRVIYADDDGPAIYMRRSGQLWRLPFERVSSRTLKPIDPQFEEDTITVQDEDGNDREVVIYVPPNTGRTRR